MNKKRKPDKEDVVAIRNQLLDFACTKHDFKLEKEEYHQEGDWNGVFIVKFRDDPQEDRLHCHTPFGEQFITFGLDLDVDEEVWKSESENIFRVASRYDIAIYVSPRKENGERRHCRLSSRAWIPNFSQRIFGLTFSNLMDCKGSILLMLADT
ncbi:MAG: hypothetical protein D8M57_14655 [Candidatus Scalindua sp. AMX11]|nr:MAG: hypothetical protein DWQ00_02815 [Candidatus Scalindua sp.]NOG83929.1 hypothetical protein [Planctomycetota bacterium]RZV88001.1 MAG: hypothetical protein EX341_06735 [Candidatus Scalindua sp. SCAELEC01]TDE64149.1 MAG: hypothetical protein D8M57_14655 [Candidatus Scalindua sp. AMX11]GJQ58422.1 MAG: hypothetical protein SCALA701_12230 [Candidatus Scalindua sp.]